MQYINDFKCAGDINSWFVVPVTWTQLIQTGDLKLIRDKEVLDELFNYYNSIKKASDNYNQFPTSMNIKAREQWTEPFVDEAYENLVELKTNNSMKRLISQRCRTSEVLGLSNSIKKIKRTI